MVEYVNIKNLPERFKYVPFISYCTNCVSDEDADIINSIINDKDTIIPLDEELTKSLEGVKRIK